MSVLILKYWYLYMKRKVTLQILTPEGYQFILNNTILAQNTFKALVLIVGASLQDMQENPSHHLILSTRSVFLIFDLFIPEG